MYDLRGRVDAEACDGAQRGHGCSHRPRRGGPRFVDPERAPSRSASPPRTPRGQQMMLDALVDLIRIAVAGPRGAALTGGRSRHHPHRLQARRSGGLAGSPRRRSSRRSWNGTSATRNHLASPSNTALRSTPHRSAPLQPPATPRPPPDGAGARSPAVTDHHPDRSPPHQTLALPATTTPKPPTGYCMPPPPMLLHNNGWDITRPGNHYTLHHPTAPPHAQSKHTLYHQHQGGAPRPPTHSREPRPHRRS